MEASDFINQHGIDPLIQEAQFMRYSGKRFSDVVDKNGFQYIDLVKHSPGFIDYSLIGYLFILEEAGIKFYNIQGSGSGATSALFFSSLGLNIHNKAIKLIKHVECKRSEIERQKLANPNTILQWFNRKISRKNLPEPPETDAYIDKIFDILGVNTWEEAENLNKVKEGQLVYRGGEQFESQGPKLALNLIDLSTRSLVELPANANLYWNNPAKIQLRQLARYATANISTPSIHVGLPQSGHDNVVNWIEAVNYRNKIPHQVAFCQQNLNLENTITKFHKTGEPGKPTFCVFGVNKRTGRSDNHSLSATESYQFASNLGNCLKHPEYQYLITQLDEANGINENGLHLTEDERLKAFLSGANRAIEFLNNFDWKVYKKFRTLDTEKVSKQSH